MPAAPKWTKTRTMMSSYNHSLPAGPLQLTDGRRVWFRPIRPDDVGRLRAFHRRLSMDTQRLRFFTPLRELSPAMAENFCNVDHDKRTAIVICYPGEDAIRGVGRLEDMGDGTAEVAFVLEDCLQGHGIGKALLSLLAAHARERGITTLTAMVLPENGAMLHVFRTCEFPSTFEIRDGAEYITLDISEPYEPKPLVAAGAA